MSNENEYELTFAEIMDVARKGVEDEIEQFEGEMPKHAGRLLVRRSADLLGTLTRIDTAEANQNVEVTDEEKQEALAEDAASILLALGALQYEHNLNIKDAFLERRDMMEAVRNADTQEDIIKAYVGEEEYEEHYAEPQHHGPEPGDNVDRDDYDGEDDRSYA